MSLLSLQLADLTSDQRSAIKALPISGVFYSDFLLEIWRDEYQWNDLVISTDSATMIGFVKNTPLGNILYSLPFGWYGGVLGDEPRADDVAAIHGWLERKAFLQENIVQFPSENYASVQYPERYQRRELQTHLLDLQAEQQLNENTRRNIKKSNDSELALYHCERNELLRFMSLLREQVARTQERRRLPEHFYSELYLHGCKETGDVVTIGATIDGELCAVHLYFRNETDIFYFDGVASDRGLELGANFLIFNEMIKRSRESGVKRFNFGATPPGDAGLERFKSGWGARKFSYTEYSRRSLLKQGIDFMVRR